MKKIKLISILLFFSGLMVLYNGCKDDECPDVPCDDPSNPECPNYDPCYEMGKINTHFTFRNAPSTNPHPQECTSLLVHCDTMWSPNILFEAPEGNPQSTYEWQIGTDPRTHTKEKFVLDFGDYITKNYNPDNPQLKLDINLTIKTPNHPCLISKSDTIIYVSKPMYYVPGRRNNLYAHLWSNSSSFTFVGSFEGYNKIDTLRMLPKNNWDVMSGFNRQGYYFTGTPIADTLIMPLLGNNDIYCFNFRHSIQYFTKLVMSPEITYPEKFISHYESLTFVDGQEDLVEIRLSTFDKKNPFNLIFKGRRIP